MTSAESMRDYYERIGAHSRFTSADYAFHANVVDKASSTGIIDIAMDQLIRAARRYVERGPRGFILAHPELASY
jgi:hypothetical protein